MSTSTLKKGVQITGEQRGNLANEMKEAYDKGKSIRELAEEYGRSYGFVHRVLKDSGVKLRGRGGDTRSKSKAGKNRKLGK